MYVRQLELVDFRSYPRVVVDFEPGPSVFVGANGMGKTNLVEALGYLSTLDSHRVATDAPLVRVGAARAVVRGAVLHDGRELLIELAIEPGKANRARLGRSPLPRARDVLGALRLVMFAPEDLALVRGDPAERRRYLDELLTLRLPRYAGVRADYERVLKQRNALLRTAYLARKAGGSKPDLSTLDVWDAHLASHGECWSLALALRLASYELLRAERVEPVLVLDDVFAELDAGRRARLADLVADATQTLVTCAVEADVPPGLRGARYEVSLGEVRRVG